MPFAIMIPLGCVIRIIILPTSRTWTNDERVGTETPCQMDNPIRILVIGEEELSDCCTRMSVDEVGCCMQGR